MQTFAAAKTVHEAKMAEKKEAEKKEAEKKEAEKKEAESKEAPESGAALEQVSESSEPSKSSESPPPSVRELVWMSPMGLPYIPKRLFMRVIEDVNPVGPERAQIVIKLAIMTSFVVFVHFVMTTLSMSDVDSGTVKVGFTYRLKRLKPQASRLRGPRRAH